ncbi:hypothetical protein SNE40_016851 [Patella caerulea]
MSFTTLPQADSDNNTSLEYQENTISACSTPMTDTSDIPTPSPPSPLADDVFTNTVNAVTLELVRAFLNPEVQNAFRPMVELILQEEINKHITPLKKEISELKLELASVSLELNGIIQDRCDDLEQYGRRNCIHISGIKETAEEIVENEALAVLSKIIPDITKHDIGNSHRVGKANKGQPKRIMLRLSSYKTKVAIMRGKKVVNAVKDDIFINEDLTRYRAFVFNIARRSYKANHINACWTRDGKISIRIRKPDGSDGQTKRIFSATEIPGYKPTPEELLQFNISNGITTDSPEDMAQYTTTTVTFKIVFIILKIRIIPAAMILS